MRVGQGVLSITAGRTPPGDKDTWGWNDKVQEVIKAKTEARKGRKHREGKRTEIYTGRQTLFWTTRREHGSRTMLWTYEWCVMAHARRRHLVHKRHMKKRPTRTYIVYSDDCIKLIKYSHRTEGIFRRIR